MREFIKTHPWRLEIVPLVVILLAIILPFVDRREALAHAHPRLGFTANQLWLLKYLIAVLFTIELGITMLQVNHSWLQAERQRKYFNFYAVSVGGTMSFYVWMFVESLSPGPMYWVWIALIPTTVALQLLIEHFRPFVPWVEPEESVPGAEDVRPGEPFYYREVHTHWWQSALVVYLAILEGLILWYVTGIWWIGVLAGAATLLLLSRTSSAFVVSNTRIAARVGYKRLSILVDDIHECGIRYYSQLYGGVTKFDGMRLYVPSAKSGPCLRIRTVDGKEYLLGLRNPRTACRLLNGAIAVRDQT